MKGLTKYRTNTYENQFVVREFLVNTKYIYCSCSQVDTTGEGSGCCQKSLGSLMSSLADQCKYTTNGFLKGAKFYRCVVTHLYKCKR